MFFRLSSLPTMPALRQLHTLDLAMSKSLERLSSGRRINRAADDPAGLAIAERMQSQWRSMRQAIRNAQDGISLLQTAEGSLNEVHAMLHRMRELSLQAANGTLQPEDRASIQVEVGQLLAEIDRTVGATEFNRVPLLTGALSAETGGPLRLQVGPNPGQMIDVTIGRMDALGLGLLATPSVPGTLALQSNSIVDALLSGGSGLADGSYRIHYDPMTSQIQLQNGSGAAVGAALTVGPLDAGRTLELGDRNRGQTVTLRLGPALPLMSASDTFQAAGWVTATGQDVNVLTAESARKSLGRIDEAIRRVTAQRSSLGATSNRLEHTINNLMVGAENLQAAESRIRDADMALEMAAFARTQIQMQAATAMMAQAMELQRQAVLRVIRA